MPIGKIGSPCLKGREDSQSVTIGKIGSPGLSGKTQSVPKGKNTVPACREGKFIIQAMFLVIIRIGSFSYCVCT